MLNATHAVGSEGSRAKAGERRSRARCACLAALLIVFVFAGCATGPSEIIRPFKVRDNQSANSLVTGARERVLVAHVPSITELYGRVVPQTIVCAEPSPDVASSVAGSFGIGLSVLGQGSASLSGAQIDSLLQLSERTVSIQLLRDQMYRACEAYSNGAINGTNYTLIMSRLNETMVSLMLGETAGGAFGRSLAATGGKAGGDATAKLAGMVGAIDDIDKAATKLAAAEKKVADAKAAQATAQQKLDDKTCGESDSACAAERKKLEGSRDEATASLAQATGERDAVKALLEASVDTASKSSAETVALAAGGGIAQKPDDKIARVLARMQKEFLRRDASQSFVEACLVELSSGRGDSALGSESDRRRLFDIGIAQAEKERMLTGANATGAMVGTRTNYRSGLYDYCVDHLADFVARSGHQRFALFTQENDIEGQELAARALEARTKAATALSESLNKCGAIQDEKAKADCLRAVAALKDEPAATPRPGPRPVAATAPPPPQYNLPSYAYEITKAAAAKLAAAVEAVPKVAATPPKGKDKIDDEDKGARKRLSDRLDALEKLKSALGVRFAKLDKTTLRALEGDQNDRRAAISLAPDDTAIELARAEMGVGEVKLKQASRELQVLADEFDRVRRDYQQLGVAVLEFNQGHQ